MEVGPHRWLKSCLDNLISSDESAMDGACKRKKRALSAAQQEQIERLFTDLLENPLSIDRYINTDHTYNLTSAEIDFFRQQPKDFHRRIYNRLDRRQKKVLNETLIDLMNGFEEHAKIHGLKYDKEFEIPSQDGLKLVYKALGNYHDEMIDWVKHTFVDKPKSVVREEKKVLETFATNATGSEYKQKVREFWSFERNFEKMMATYEQKMKVLIFDHYLKMLDYITSEDKIRFPRTLPNLLDHIARNSHLFTLDLRNETTTDI